MNAKQALPAAAIPDSENPQVRLKKIFHAAATSPDPRLRQFAETLEKFLQDCGTFGKKFAAGEATLKEGLEFLISTPPWLQAYLSQKPHGAIYLPENFATQEALYAGLYGPRTPLNSQFAAVVRVTGNSLKLDLGKHFGALVSAMFNIGKHTESGTPLRPESLKVYDNHLRLLARFGALRKPVPPMLGDRLHIAMLDRDKRFSRKLYAAYATNPDLRSEKLLVDLQLGPLKESLLRWWAEIPGWQPKVALCEFQFEAIGRFLELNFPNAGEKSFEWEKVRDAIRRLGLVRAKPARVKLVKCDKDKVLIKLDNRLVHWKPEIPPKSPK